LSNKTRGAQQGQVEQTTTEKIKANQMRLHAQRQQDGLKRWAKGDGGKANGQDKAIKRYESYRREEQLPRAVEERRVSISILSSSSVLIFSRYT
jgi:nucleosome binding factor SPN SPT16 subunit